MSEIRITKEQLAKVANQTIKLAFAFTEGDVKKGDKEARRWVRWDWSIGVAFYGLIKAYETLRDDTIISAIKKWIDARIENVDSICVNTCGLLPAVMYINEIYPDDRYQKIMNLFDDYVMHKALRTPCGAISHSVIGSELEGEIWADTLFMSILYIALRGAKLQNQAYIDEAIKQLILHIDALQDREDGLFWHGFDDVHKKDMGVKWGRGNAWVTVSTIEILNAIPGDFQQKAYVLDRLNDQLRGLHAYQHDGGMWHTVIDYADSYLETSVTAGIAYGVLKGITGGMVDVKYRNMAHKAIGALISNIDPDGSILCGSTGTPIKRNPAEYNRIPYHVTPFTQGLALMALTAV